MNRLAGIFAALLVLAGAAVPAAAQDKSITVFAAASMKNALDDIDAAYTAKTGVKVIVSYGPSSGLANAVPFCTTSWKRASRATSQSTSTMFIGIPPPSSGLGASRVQRTTPSGSGSPEATPSANG